MASLPEFKNSATEEMLFFLSAADCANMNRWVDLVEKFHWHICSFFLFFFVTRRHEETFLKSSLASWLHFRTSGAKLCKLVLFHRHLESQGEIVFHFTAETHKSSHCSDLLRKYASEKERCTFPLPEVTTGPLC